MKAIYWIIPGLLAGRPGPYEVPWNLQELWDGGFRTIVSLARADRREIEAAGFRHYHAPMIGSVTFLPPVRHWMARKMLPIVEFVVSEMWAGRPTLVHCYIGKDRTGAVLAGSLMRGFGFSPDEAIRHVRQINPRAMSALGFDRLPKLFERHWIENQSLLSAA